MLIVLFKFVSNLTKIIYLFEDSNIFCLGKDSGILQPIKLVTYLNYPCLQRKVSYSVDNISISYNYQLINLSLW